MDKSVLTLTVQKTLESLEEKENLFKNQNSELSKQKTFMEKSKKTYIENQLRHKYN